MKKNLWVVIFLIGGLSFAATPLTAEWPIVAPASDAGIKQPNKALPAGKAGGLGVALGAHYGEGDFKGLGATKHYGVGTRFFASNTLGFYTDFDFWETEAGVNKLDPFWGFNLNFPFGRHSFNLGWAGNIAHTTKIAGEVFLISLVYGLVAALCDCEPNASEAYKHVETKADSHYQLGYQFALHENLNLIGKVRFIERDFLFKGNETGVAAYAGTEYVIK